MTSIQARALELKNQGLTFTQIMQAMSLPSRASAAGHVHRARRALAGHIPAPRPDRKFDRQIFFYDTHIMAAKLDEIATEWGCSRSEVLRTFVACSLEDYYEE